MIELEVRPRVSAEGTLVSLAPQYDPPVAFGDLDPLEACDQKVVSELGEGAASIDEAS